MRLALLTAAVLAAALAAGCDTSGDPAPAVTLGAAQATPWCGWSTATP